jgi:predicted nucleic acid-binding protein
VRACYLDTSALLKWYGPEAGSEDFEAFVRRIEDPVVSRLVIVECRCALARRARRGTLARAAELEAWQLLRDDLANGYLRVLPLADTRLIEALELIERLIAHPLRTLDALHLACALAAAARTLATADRTMASAGEALGLEIAFFGAASP